MGMVSVLQHQLNPAFHLGPATSCVTWGVASPELNHSLRRHSTQQLNWGFLLCEMEIITFTVGDCCKKYNVK